MPNVLQLRLNAREIFDEALRAVDSAAAVRSAIQCKVSELIVRGEHFDLGDRPIYSIAIGKAASAMAAALDARLGARFSAGVLSGPPLARSQPSARWNRFDGGHPIPNEASLLAAKASFTLLERANTERALIIYLISGGGSAMLESPVTDEISLADLRTANRVLVNCGATISEINSVRRRFSAVKGGKLAERAPDCEQITLTVSDVPEGEEQTVASGPTTSPSSGSPKASEVINRYDLASRLPASILNVTETESDSTAVVEPANQNHFVLLSNTTAVEAAAAAARARGFITEIATDISDQRVEDGCAQLLNRLQALRTKHRANPNGVCLISGGEFSCPVNGDGIGGRNQETALRLALALNSELVGVCGGTDGIDGNSPAAGAIIDNTTLERAGSIGIDANDFLRRSDAYSFFVALGDALSMGPTGTNVRDVRILLAAS